MKSAAVTADRLLRCYPAGWRERYGEEFAELLVDDISERPHSPRRTVDVAVAGLRARLSAIGLGSGPIGTPLAALATVAVAITGFVGCGISLWSQLLVGWQSSPPPSRAVVTGTIVISIAVGYLCLLASLAAVPILAEVARATRRRGARRLVGPIASIAIGLGVLLIGGRHFAAGLPAGVRAGWRYQWLAPAELARFTRAETLGISTYWAHPATLLALPRPELAWMVASPAMLAAVVAGAVIVVRRAGLPPAVIRYEARLARAAVIGLVPYLAAAGWWVLSSRTGPAGVFQAGSLDLLLIAIMTAAMAVAHRATQQFDRRLSAG